MQWDVRSINDKILELQNKCNVHDIILLAEMCLGCEATPYLRVLI
jgi:hypothetical protein